MPSRKDNPDYEKVQVKSKTGAMRSVYRKKQNKSASVADKKAKVAVASKPVAVKKEKKVRKPRAKKNATASQTATASLAGAQFAPNTDQNKPLTNPATDLAQSKAELMLDVAEGLSQKELDRLNRVNRVKKRVAQVKAQKLSSSSKY